MQAFFDRPDTTWRYPERCLHIYALPAAQSPVHGQFAAISGLLEGLPQLARQPSEFLHATVQRLDAFEHEVDTALLGDVLDRAVRSHAAFPVQFAPPVPGTHAVEVWGSPILEWRSLTAAVRAAVTDAGLGSALTPPPVAPHVSIAYCRAAVADSEVAAALKAADRPTSFTVRSLSLVSVDQDRLGSGITFRVLREVELRG